MINSLVRGGQKTIKTVQNIFFQPFLIQNVKPQHLLVKKNKILLGLSSANNFQNDTTFHASNIKCVRFHNGKYQAQCCVTRRNPAPDNEWAAGSSIILNHSTVFLTNTFVFQYTKKLNNMLTYAYGWRLKIYG